MGGNQGTAEQQWFAAFNNTLSHRNNRLLVVFNFEGVVNNTDCMGALASILSPENAPQCLVEPPWNVTVGLVSFMSSSSSSSSISVSILWGFPGYDVDSLFLDVALTPQLLPSGALADPTVIAHAPVNASALSYTFSLDANEYGNATLWASFVAVGCSGSQSIATDALQIVLPGERERR